MSSAPDAPTPVSIESGAHRASCHPDKWAHCRGLCKNCYQKRYRGRFKNAHPEHHRNYMRTYRKTHPKYMKKRAAHQRERYRTSKAYREQGRIRQRRRMLKKRGFTEESYQTLLMIQDFKCAICKAPLDGKWHDGPQPDHDHKNGKARGILCTDCNTKLGKIEDEVWRGLAAKYLARFEVVNVASENA